MFETKKKTKQNVFYLQGKKERKKKVNMCFRVARVGQVTQVIGTSRWRRLSELINQSRQTVLEMGNVNSPTVYEREGFLSLRELRKAATLLANLQREQMLCELIFFRREKSGKICEQIFFSVRRVCNCKK